MNGATGSVRLAVVDQSGGGGAMAAAREVLEWAPGRGFELRYHASGGDPARLLEELGSWGPALVHVHCWYGDHPYGLLRELAQRFPTVLTVHDVAVVNQYGEECWECYRNPWCLGCPALEPLRRWRPNYRVLARLRKRRANRATRCHLVLPSHWMARRLARSELSRLPSTVIPYGVDTERFHPGEGAREAFGLPGGPLVLFSGNMYSPQDHRKGLPDLLEAWPAVRGGCPTATLVVAGAVEGIPERPGVGLLGEVGRERLPELYRCADLFCLPSRGDNLPVAVLEAMASGLPVVGTEVGGIPEELDGGRAGALVPPRDPQGLARALLGLLGDPGRASVLGRAARDRAVAAFSREVSAALHEELYRRILPAPRRDR